MIKVGDKTIIVNLKYKGADFFGRSELSKEGTILWAGHTIFFAIGENDPGWDEIIVVIYHEEKLYNNVIEQLSEENRLSYYKILLVGRYPQATIDRVNKMRYQDTSVDTTIGDYLGERTKGGIDPTQEQMELLLQRNKTIPLVLLNIVKYRKMAVYPESYDGKKNITGKEASILYGLNSAKIQGTPMVDVKMDLAGEIISFIVGNNKPEWDHFFFARYPSLEQFLNLLNSTLYQQGIIHRDAALERSYVWAITPYEDF